MNCHSEAAIARTDGSDGTALREAVATFERLEARPVLNLARLRFRELGVTIVPRGPRPSTRSNPARLTQREMEVVTLVAAGQSTTGIAIRLFLSHRTVENHVASILTNLGVSTRHDAAKAAIRLGLVNPTEREC